MATPKKRKEDYDTLGRPPEYSEKILVASKKYIEQCKDTEYKLIKTDGKASTTWENKIKVNLPTIEGLCIYLDIARVTAYDWGKKYPEFSYILEELQKSQARKLIEGGLSGNYNPVIAKLLLGKHGYRDEKAIEHSGGIVVNPEQKAKIDEALDKLL